MQKVTLVAIDLAKNVFWVYGADNSGRKIFSRSISRSKLAQFVQNLPSCTIAMEACGSSHHWGRKFFAMGHEVKLIAPQFVKPFVKSNKNDANDAEAIAEAAVRPSMRFVQVKTVEQQDLMSLHRVRERLISFRTALINEVRGLLSEYGIVFPKGPRKFKQELACVLENADSDISAETRRLMALLQNELAEIESRIKDMDAEIENFSESHEVAKRLKQVPGVGPLTATAIIATVGRAQNFKNGREMSAYLGLIPKQHSSGGKQNLGGISKRGDKYLRKLLIHGARAVLYNIARREDKQAQWLKALIERRGFNKACVALANKNVRAMAVMLKTGANYQPAA